MTTLTLEYAYIANSQQPYNLCRYNIHVTLCVVNSHKTCPRALMYIAVNKKHYSLVVQNARFVMAELDSIMGPLTHARLPPVS